MQSNKEYFKVWAVDTAKMLIDFPYILYLFIRAIISSIYKSLNLKSKSLENETILVTGAASGLGREVVLKLAKISKENRVQNKVVFVLWDVNEKGLKETKDKCIKLGVNKVHTYVVDLTKRENIAKYAELVKHNVGPVTMLFNNAGIAAFKTFMEIDPNLEENIIKINLLSYMWTIREFLPEMLKNRKGHIICTCSGLGFYRFSHLSAYCASKYGLKGFLECLKLEMRQLNPDNPDAIKFSTIYPGFVKTPMTDSFQWQARYKTVEEMNFINVDWAAEQITDGILKEKEDIYVPGSMQKVKWLYSLLPTEFVDNYEKFVMRNIKYTTDEQPNMVKNNEQNLARDHGE